MSRQDDGGVNDRGYTRDQQVMLDDAKRTHAATTATAQRALQVLRCPLVQQCATKSAVPI